MHKNFKKKIEAWLLSLILMLSLVQVFLILFMVPALKVFSFFSKTLKEYQVIISTIVAIIALYQKSRIDNKRINNSERKLDEQRRATNFAEYHKLVELFYGISSPDGRPRIPAQKVAIIGMLKYSNYDKLSLSIFKEYLSVTKKMMDELPGIVVAEGSEYDLWDWGELKNTLEQAIKDIKNRKRFGYNSAKIK